MDKPGAVEIGIVRILTSLLCEFGRAVSVSAARHAAAHGPGQGDAPVFQRRAELGGHAADCLVRALAREQPEVLRRLERGEVSMPQAAAELEAARARRRESRPVAEPARPDEMAS